MSWNIVAGLFFVVVGLIFFVGTVLGVHRFPDLYTRMHGASKGDTLSSMLFVFGIILLSLDGWSTDGMVRASKLAFIIVFLFLSSPAASHALVDAAYKQGIRPWSPGTPELDCPGESPDTETAVDEAASSSEESLTQSPQSPQSPKEER